jgi:uncharacterized phage protein (TIGR02218 family)
VRAASPALLAYLGAQRTAKDAPLLMADCFTFTLRTGTVLTYTNADVPITLGGVTFAANSVLVDGLAFNCKAGLDVDQQKITLAARPTDTVGGVPFLVALARGVFDGCEVQRERVFLSGWTVPPIGSVILFKGRMTTVDQIGRTSAQVTVASDLVLLDIDMPRNFYQLTCVHTLYDSGCGLTKNAFGTNGTIGAGPTTATMPWSGAAAVHTQGTILFTSGANAGLAATIKSVAPGAALSLSYPLYVPPAPGDGFIAYQGCDHRLNTCRAQFNNVSNFRGFPYIPPPTSAY